MMATLPAYQEYEYQCNYEEHFWQEKINLIDVHVYTCVQQQVHCWGTQVPCMCLLYVGPQYNHTEEES